MDPTKFQKIMQDKIDSMTPAEVHAHMDQHGETDAAREALARKVLGRCAEHKEWKAITGPLGNGRQCTECGYQERTDEDEPLQAPAVLTIPDGDHAILSYVPDGEHHVILRTSAGEVRTRREEDVASWTHVYTIDGKRAAITQQRV